jgi:nucleoid-associated protein YgaU
MLSNRTPIPYSETIADPPVSTIRNMQWEEEMRKLFYAVLFLAGIALPASVTAGFSTSTDATPATYTVKKGDTLSSLAKKFYQTPLHWTKIWEANKTAIKDNYAIYPGQVLTIPDKSAPVPPVPPAPAQKAEQPAGASCTPEKISLKANEAPAAPVQQGPAEDEAPAAEAPATGNTEPAAAATGAVAEEAPAAAVPAAPAAAVVAQKQGFGGESFVAPRSWEIDGLVIGDKDKKLMISDGDTVYVNLGEDRVKPGLQCMVYRKKDKVKDPYTREMVGYEVHRVGRIEITRDVGRDVSSAKVVTAYEPIEVGDIVKIIGKE